MRISFTFHNLESSESLKRLAQEKLAKLQKYLHGPLDAAVTFSVEKHMHCVDVNIHAGGENYIGRNQNEDMYAAINLVIDKIREQVRRVHDQQQQHRREATLDVPGE
jgi:putative sigma-54 modulation protein